jgi:hypothetical protein
MFALCAKNSIKKHLKNARNMPPAPVRQPRQASRWVWQVFLGFSMFFQPENGLFRYI